VKANFNSTVNATANSLLKKARLLLNEELNSWLQQQSWDPHFSQALRHCAYDAGKAFRPALIWAVRDSFANEAESVPPFRIFKKTNVRC
jgi:geranylgeranyl pyrophosphate synthase